MKAKLTWLCIATLTLSLALAGCSDDDKTDPGQKDGGETKVDGKTVPPDTGNGLPDGYKLWECKTPGATCNAHDPCAINPTCSADLKCIPAKLQNCNDDLPCTTDTCAGLGVCKNEPIAGQCALAVRVPKGATCAQVKGGKVKFDAGVPADGGTSTSDGSAKDASTAVDLSSSTEEKETIFCCFKKGDRSPTDQCSECNPDSGDDATVGGNSKKWSAANGGSCDDKNLCTKNDYCQYGICKGTSFLTQCSDGYACTDDMCDGKGGCLGNKMKIGWCLINATCYKDGAMHPGGSCSTCDSKKNNADWTTVTSTCMISNKCYKAGDKDTTGCNICDPKTSTTSWTAIAGVCSIDGKCYKPGDKHTLGCAECDPKTSQTKWTVKGSFCLITNKCYAAKALDTTGCNECDPTKDKYKWSAVSGLCSIGGKCYKPKDKNTGGCAECDPTVSQTKWTVKGTTDCLIGTTCYKAAVKDSTGCKECAPATTKYDWSTVANTCLISGKCYAKNATNTGSCATCLPATNAKGWTVTGSDCLINDTCYKPKAKDSTGCGECIPAYDKYNWSVTKAASCLISSSCVASGTKDPSGCATCDPTKSTTAWSPLGNKCLILGDCVAAKKKDSSNCLQCKVATSKSQWTPVSAGATATVYDFETGMSKGWTLTNSVKNYGWNVTSNRKYEGKYSLYYGNPSTKNYNSTTKNDGTAVAPAISLTSGKKAGLHLRLYMDVESSTSYDKFKIFVGTTKVWEKGVDSSTMKKWLNIHIDLSKYAGSSVKVTFDFDSMDTVSNSTEGIFVDAIVFYEGC